MIFFSANRYSSVFQRCPSYSTTRIIFSSVNVTTQDSLTKANAESMSKKAKQKEQKLEKAEENVSRLVNQFRDESKEVERAMALLKEVGLNEEPMSKLVDLKKAGLVKQGAVVGTLLFTLRSFGEFALFFSMDDSSRLLPAEIQGFIALACAALVAFS